MLDAADRNDVPGIKESAMTTKRKSAASLSAVEQKRYLDVIKALVADPTNPYGNLVGAHVDMSHDQHPGMGPIVSPADPDDTVGTERFLSWHRDYLLKLERLGQTLDAAFFVPYWDWRTQRTVPDWFQAYKPIIQVAGTTVHVRRNPPRPGQSLPTTADISTAMAISTFTKYVEQINLPHGQVHNWCNGTMSNPMISPADPLFWMHHAFLDKLWSERQVTNPGQSPNVSGTDRILDPWFETIDDVASIAALDYQYV
jgi:tyrosinase-like protein